MKIMKCIFLTTFMLFLFNINAFSQDIITKSILGAKDTLVDTAIITKYIFTPPKKAKKLITSAIKKLNSECCEENFQYKKDVAEIKNNLKACLDKKCQNFMLPLYSKKKPPAKAIALKQVKLIDDLLIENEKQKYQNLVTKMELDLTEKEKNQKKAKIENEKDIQSVKNQLLNKEKENEKLKKTVNKMLANYQKKFLDLKKENQILEDNLNLVFEAHSKSKQKKLSEQFK